MGLFDKKICDVCGEKIKMFGNNKLADGNLCDPCEKKLAVWFTNHRKTTVMQVKQMLMEREANARLLNSFRATRQIGTTEDKFFLIDDNMGRFVILRNGENMQKNPELLELSRVSSARLEIKEDTSEIRRKDANGNSVSFNPKHYSYKYNFIMHISYNSPYYPEINFPLNTFSINGGEDSDNWSGNSMGGNVTNNNVFYSGNRTQRDNLPGGYRTDGLTTMKDIDVKRYQEYERAGNEIAAILMRQPVQGQGLGNAAGQTVRNAVSAGLQGLAAMAVVGAMNGMGNNNQNDMNNYSNGTDMNYQNGMNNFSNNMGMNTQNGMNNFSNGMDMNAQNGMNGFSNNMGINPQNNMNGFSNGMGMNTQNGMNNFSNGMDMNYQNNMNGFSNNMGMNNFSNGMGMNNQAWVCSCGQQNTGPYCQNCGAQRH